MAFESVKKNAPTWEPKQSGSKKTDDLKPRTPGDDSWLVGYYVSTKHDAGKEGKSTIHTLRYDSCGDESFMSEPVEKGEDVVIWGTGVLNNNLSKIAPGSFCKIVWEGKKKPKTAGGNDYHTWDVLVDSSVEPLSTGTSFSADEVPAAAEAVASEEADDDLPF